MNWDLHVHSKYSYDSFLTSERIIKAAKKKGLDGVAITDHGTIKGGVEASKLNKDKNFKIIVGAEIKTEYGDVIGLFLNEDIQNRKFIEVLDEIKSQGGLIVLAHPYRQYKFPEKFVGQVDIVEGFNARSKLEHNVKALKLAQKFNKSVVAGSDAHTSFEIGRGRTIIDSDIEKCLINGDTEIEGMESNYYLSHGLSVLTEKIKHLV